MPDELSYIDSNLLGSIMSALGYKVRTVVAFYTSLTF